MGATAVYALVMQGIGSELVLVDKNKAWASAQVIKSAIDDLGTAGE